ncbi:hypothetical protein [Streptomyces asiaticus]|uniref:hypothetical protein n=1 Tax=Streptomyces asiaticus TaxID=114695 RepID=UPI001BA561BD|nr:hypothetical protein [Streptomyces asiaticus]
MPLDEPVTSQGNLTWTISATHGPVSVTAQVIAEGSGGETDGDSALQDLVDALHRSAAFTNVSGTKSYMANTTRAMRPSS